jgi:tRNA-Thr(GGU) m(6)t(6)A37 methyltransferase TsaA
MGRQVGWQQLSWLALPCGAAIAGVVWAHMASEETRLRAELASVATELARSEQARVKAEKLRHEERTGRTRAEKRIQEICQHLPPDADVGAAKSQRRSKPTSGAMPSRASRRSKQLPTFSYQAIGEIASCFVERNGCPRQGKISPSSRAWLQLRGDINPAGCTDGLAEYTHLQIIFVFHANTNLDKTATTATGASAVRFKAKIAPPRLQGSRKVGTLATRSPHRPNPIGLSTARIEGVDPVKGRVLLSGLDLLDGTPVLDIKPYIPDYDSVPEAIVPDWVREPSGAGAMAAVRWAPGAREKLAIAAARGKGKALRTLPDVASVSAVAEEVLAWDVRSTIKRQRAATVGSGTPSSGSGPGSETAAAATAAAAARHKIVLDGLEIHFQILAERVVEIVDFIAISGSGRMNGGGSSSGAARALKDKQVVPVTDTASAAAAPAAAPAASTANCPVAAPLKAAGAGTAQRGGPDGGTAVEILSQPPAAVLGAVTTRTGRAMRWLVLGDGDFSFSLALATACGGCRPLAPRGVSGGDDGGGLVLVASSLDSQEDLVLKYGQGVLETLAKLRELGAIVLHRVDATNLPETLSQQLLASTGGGSGSGGDGDGSGWGDDRLFDRVTFQFPLCGATLSKAAFEAAAVPAELRNRHLIAETLRGGAVVLRPEGELVVSAKADNKYDMRFFCKPPPAAAPSPPTTTPTAAGATAPSLVYATQWLFDIAQYPGYTPRNVETNESFPIANSVSFAFVHQDRLGPLGLASSAANAGGGGEAGGAGRSGGSSVSSPLTCELCGITCSGEAAFEAHGKGTKHRRNAALERKWEVFWSKRKEQQEQAEAGGEGEGESLPPILLSSRG